jgi:hypothetical protein
MRVIVHCVWERAVGDPAPIPRRPNNRQFGLLMLLRETEAERVKKRQMCACDAAAGAP